MWFYPESFREDVTALVANDSNRPLNEAKVAAYAADILPALRFREPPWCVLDSHALAFAIRLTNATQLSKIETFQNLENPETAQAALGKLNADKVRTVIAAIGHFVPSFVEPKVSKVPAKTGSQMPIALGKQASTPTSAVFASGLNTQAAIATSFAGNAADNRIAKLLSARIGNAQGQVATMLEHVVANDAIGQTLGQLGLDPQVIKAATAAFQLKQNAGLREVTAIDGDRMKCLFVPDNQRANQGGYRQVTPVPSVALYTELPNRLRQRRDNGYWVPTSRSVMSAKPQNVGLQASYQGGQLTRIHGRYRPIAIHTYQRKLAALGEGAAAFFTASMLSDSEDPAYLGELIKTILGSDGKHYVNADIRARRDYRARRLVQSLLDAMRDFQGYCSDLPELHEKGAFARQDYVSEVLVLGKRNATSEELAAITQEMTLAILQAILQAGGQLSKDDAQDERVRRMIYEPVLQVLKRELAA